MRKQITDCSRQLANHIRNNKTGIQVYIYTYIYKSSECLQAASCMDIYLYIKQGMQYIYKRYVSSMMTDFTISKQTLFIGTSDSVYNSAGKDSPIQQEENIKIYIYTEIKTRKKDRKNKQKRKNI